MSTNSARTHFRTCNLCEAMCGLEIQATATEVLSIKGDKNDLFSRGHICPKALGLKEIYEDPDRLKRPLKKVDGQFEEISWETAFSEIGARLRYLQKEYGNDAIGLYQGNPAAHNLGTMLFGPPFVRSLRTKSRFSATSVDQLPHHVAAWTMFGHLLRTPVPDIDHTNYLMILGGNPLVSNGSLMTAPDFGKRMRAISERGKVVVIDPRRTETANKADEHYFVKPGTDVALLLAMAHEIIANGWAKPGRLADFTEGYDRFIEITKPYTAAWAAPICGIKADTIQSLAKAFASADKAILYGRLGLSVVPFGGLSQWLINCLNWLTGNLDEVGGMMFPKTAVNTLGSKGMKDRMARWHTRVRNLPEFGGELPVSALAEEITTAGEGQIKAMITSCGNPVLSTPNGQQLDQAFESLDLMVCIDIYLNETTRHADYILPPATGLEVPHYDMIFHNLAIRNTAKYSEPLFEKDPAGKYDWEIFNALRQEIDPSPNPMDNLTPETALDFGLQSGPYDLSLADLKTTPHGIDLGPLQPQFPEGLFTPASTINLCPDLFVDDLDRMNAFFKAELVQSEEFPLLLIGRRELRSNNSWMHNLPVLMKGPKRCVAMIHPQDGEKLDIQSGDEITVRSRVNELKIEALITDEIMPGVISIPHGYGHLPEGIQMEVANAHAGVSVNDLTDDQYIDALTGNAVLNGVPVMVA
ncbi:MAG: molybdopterin-dependent oxidoreductase [Bacteroidota bacterium]